MGDLVNGNMKKMTLTEKVEAAFQQAAILVIERARQTGTSVIVWEDDHVLERTCDEMEVLLKINQQGVVSRRK
ncbi:hypothetical protein V5E97_36275 [Singulisphaera sp. Ch08]|uniref:Uncharacterized protein n=1 Tax=Singulisphaera sp. Ch08 TaxID=3120278 RepID=A0AAU7CED8_9BACT